jgi:beta-phosphoglucomutase family hydrolase
MSGRNSRAVIWDMDGVIVDTASKHYQAWQYSFQKRGFILTWDEYRNLFGRRNDTIIRTVMGQELPQKGVDEVSAEKEAYYSRIIRGNIRPLPGAVELIRSLPDHDFRSAIASSALKDNIEYVLQTIGVREFFQAVVAGRDVVESKPSPQIYLLAAERLGVNPRHCIVIEDAVAGVEGAKRAGMNCIAVTTTHPREKLAIADLVVDTLASVSVADLEKLLNSADSE